MFFSQKIFTGKKMKKGGFTIIELMVSIALFTATFIAISSSFISIVDAYRKIMAERVNVDNLSTAVESMVRGLKTGTNFHCGSGGNIGEAQACPGGDTYLAFEKAKGNPTDDTDQIVYRLMTGRLERSDDGGANFYPVTDVPSVITISNLKFYVVGSVGLTNGDTVQPKAVIVMSGTVGTGVKKSSTFSIQTTITQRLLDDGSGAVAGASDSTPPSDPIGFSATTFSSSQINLTWTASSDPESGVSGYRVERCQGSGCSSFSEISSPSSNSFSDTGLLPSTSYSYRVRAVNGDGLTSGYSATASAATPASSDTTAPTTPGTPVASAVTSSTLTLNWTASTDAVGVTGYRVERCLTSSCTYAQVGTPASNSFNDSGLSANTGYTYRVRATDAAGNLSSYSGTVAVTTATASDTTAPTTPGTPVASAVTSSTLTLNWTASTDAVGVTGYRVERCLTSSCTYAQVGTPASNSFNDSGLSANTGYTYRVRATDAAGNLSSYSGTVAVTTATAASLAIDASSPATVKTNTATFTTASFTPPAGSVLYITIGSQQAITAITDNRASHLTYTKEAAYGNTSNDTIATLYTAPVTTSMAMTVSVTQAASSNYVMMKVLVVTGADTGNPVGAIGGGRGVTGVVSDTYVSTANNSWGWLIYADWNVMAIPTAGTNQNVYDSYMSSYDTYALIRRNSSTPTSGTSVTMNTTAPTSGTQTSHLYFEMNPAGAPPPPDTTAPTTPGTPVASAVTSSTLTLNWTASTDAVGVTGYRVERCLTSSCTYAQVGTPASNSFNDSGLSANTGYTYRVRATDAAGNLSSYSGTVAVTTAASGGNIAPSGTAYRWYNNTTATANTNKVAAAGLNDANLTTDVDLSGIGGDSTNMYEAGGVIWASSQTVSSVKFINGSFENGYDGVFSANLRLQFTTDGTTWTNSSWAVSPVPAYSYDSSASAGVTYTFTGTATAVRGVRVSGQVYLSSSSSYYENMREVQVF